MENGKKLGTMSAWWVLLLGVITNGLYYPIWISRRRKTLTSLKTRTSLTGALTKSMWGFLIATITLALMAMTAGAEKSDDAAGGLIIFATLTGLVYGGLFLVALFRIRRILIEHCQKHLHTDAGISALGTLFLGPIYLQYKMNHIPVADPQRVIDDNLRKLFEAGVLTAAEYEKKMRKPARTTALVGEMSLEVSVDASHGEAFGETEESFDDDEFGVTKACVSET